jgi:hypothetical protein
MILPASFLALALALGTHRATGDAPAPEATPRTIVVPDDEAPVSDATGAQTVVWCATWQMAWDALADALGERHLSLGPPAPPELVEAMNRRRFPRRALGEDGVVVEAGLVRDGVLGRIADGMKRLGREPPGIQASADDMVAFAGLFRSLAFPVAFAPLERPLRFAGSSVEAFGVEHTAGDAEAQAMRRQVTVLHEGGDEEFVLEIGSRDGQERLVLAVVVPQRTLIGTWREVVSRCARSQPRPLGEHAGLVVPRLRFDLLRRYTEIVGARVRLGDAWGGPIGEAWQRVTFSLDAGGADLDSTAVITARGGSREYRCAHPFLLALTRRESDIPYLLVWVANAEVLVPR